MAFQPIKFTYDPPLTVEDFSSPVIIGDNTSVLQTNTEIIANSRSTQLIATIAALQETNAYLQKLVLAASSDIVVKIDTDINPALANAANAVYGTIPAGITAVMYSTLLDAEIQSQSLLTELQNTENQLNQVQQSYLSSVTSAVDDTLSDDVSYSSQVPLLLRSLKTDSAILQSISDGLASYPVQTLNPSGTATATTAAIPAQNTDISSDLAASLTRVTTSLGSNYSAINTLLVTPAVINSDLAVANVMATQTVADVARIVTLVQSAKGLFYKNSLKSFNKDLSNFAYTRLAADATVVVFAADKLLQMAINPLASIEGQMGVAVAQVKRLIDTVGTAPTGTHLAGLCKANSACNAPQNASTNPLVQADLKLMGLSVSLFEAASHLLWIQQKTEKSIAKKVQQFERLVGRKLGIQQEHTNLLSSLKSAESLVALAATTIGQLTGNTSATQALSSPVSSTVTAAVNSVAASASPTVIATLK